MGSSKVGHFDESEVQEIGFGDTDYPELLRAIRKPPKPLRFRGNLPPNTKKVTISGSRETTQQALQTAYRIGKMLAEHEYTLVTGLAEGCDATATDGALSAVIDNTAEHLGISVLFITHHLRSDPDKLAKVLIKIY